MEIGEVRRKVGVTEGYVLKRQVEMNLEDGPMAFKHPNPKIVPMEGLSKAQ